MGERLDFSHPDQWVLVNTKTGEVWDWDEEKRRWTLVGVSKQKLRQTADVIMQRLLNMA